MYDIPKRVIKYLNECNWIWCYGIGDDHVLEIFITKNIYCGMAKEKLRKDMPCIQNIRIGRVVNPNGESPLKRKDKIQHYIFN